MSVTSKSKRLHPIEASAIHARRERVFLVIAGLFLGTLAMLNILGIMRFITFGTIETELFGPLPISVAIGVLPYPVTFLCTDLISELYGRARANAVVWVGLLINAWVLFILWLGGVLPGVDTGEVTAKGVSAYDQLQLFAFGATMASMAAYLMAQFTDVWMFHFWKKLTKGKHLWLRNNGSTLVSQIVDTVAVILITWWVGGLAGVLIDEAPLANQLIGLMVAGYVFKFLCALLDTIPLYWLVPRLSRWLELDPDAEHRHLEDPGPDTYR
jgi:uncharacterized integral membrane protein (TIGR00697 family)